MQRQLQQRLRIATAIEDITYVSNNVFGGSVSAVVTNEAFEVNRRVQQRRREQGQQNISTSRKRELDASYVTPDNCSSATNDPNDSIIDVDRQPNNDRNIDLELYEGIEIINRANCMKRMTLLLRSINENQRLLLQELHALQTIYDDETIEQN